MRHISVTAHLRLSRSCVFDMSLSHGCAVEPFSKNIHFPAFSTPP